jgi:hypothetical protein
MLLAVFLFMAHVSVLLMFIAAQFHKPGSALFMNQLAEII